VPDTVVTIVAEEETLGDGEPHAEALGEPESDIEAVLVTVRDSTEDGVRVRSVDAENVGDPEIDADSIALFDGSVEREPLIVTELHPVPDTLLDVQ